MYIYLRILLPCPSNWKPYEKADISGAPRIISEVGSSNSGEIKALEPPADHKGAATAIIVVFAFIFAVAGVFIGVYFRVERVLKVWIKTFDL